MYTFLTSNSSVVKFHTSLQVQELYKVNQRGTEITLTAQIHTSSILQDHSFATTSGPQKTQLLTVPKLQDDEVASPTKKKLTVEQTLHCLASE